MVYDIYEHETGSCIHVAVDAKFASITTQLDEHGLIWAIEEYGRCDTNNIVVLEHGNPYPGKLDCGPWVIVQFDRNGELECTFGPFTILKEAKDKTMALAANKKSRYNIGEVMLNDCTTVGNKWTPFFVTITPNKEPEPECAWHTWEVRVLIK